MTKKDSTVSYLLSSIFVVWAQFDICLTKKYHRNQAKREEYINFHFRDNLLVINTYILPCFSGVH